MKKNFFFGLFTLATMMVTSSCSEQELVDPSLLNGDVVTFTVNLQQSASTRAAAELAGRGTLANKLYYGVYEKNGNDWDLIPAISALTRDYTYNIENPPAPATIQYGTPTKVEIKLAKQKEYSVIFWAANAENNMCNVDWTARTMTMKETGSTANNEKNDVFWAHNEVKVNAAVAKTVDLYRPFAQLNIGASIQDIEDAAAAEMVVEKSQIVLNKVANTFNMETGEASGNTTLTYSSADILNADNWKFPVEYHQYIALGYVLANTNDKSLVDVELTYTDTKDNDYNSSFTSVPVQRNFRTNIYGNLLSNSADYNVNVKPDLDGEVNSEVEVALQLAAQAGGTFTLTENLTLTSPLTVTADFVLNLSGNTISGTFSDKDNETVINNTANLTLIGGEIKNAATNGAAVITNSGKLVLKDVTINGAPIGTDGYPAYAVMTSGGELTVEEGTTISSDRGVIHMSNGANVTINGGNIKVTNALGTRILSAHVIYASGSDSKLTINNGNFEMAYEAQGNTGASVICPAGATIKVFNGEFSYAGVQGNQSGIFQNYMGYGAPVDVYGGTYNDESVTKSGNLAEGYKAIEKDGKWYVVANDVNAIVSNDSELQTAFAAGHTTINLKAGTYDTKNFQVVGKTINLKGIEEGVRIYNSQNIDVASTSFDMCTVTFENLTIETLGGNYKGFARMNGTYKNCTIVNNYFTFYGKHLFENCTFNAPALTGSFKNEHCVWTYGAEEVDFVDCKFNYSDRCVNVYVDNGGNAPGITSDVAFTNCVFNTENAGSEGAVEVNSTPFTAGVKVVLENCKAPAHGKMVYVSPWDGTKGKNATITVDGVVVAGLSSVLANAPEGSTIVLAEDVNLGEVTVGELKNVTILGSENTSMRFVTNAYSKIENVTIKNIDFEFTTGASQKNGACVVIDAEAQIDNLVIENVAFVGDGKKNSYGIYGQNSNASIVIKNCSFSNIGYAIQTTSGGGYESLIVEKCTFDNIISWAILPQYGYNGDLTINDCTFKNSNGGLVKTGAINGTFTFTNNTITNCTGHDGKDSKWFEVNASAATKVIDGNTKDGVAWIPGEANGLN